MLCLPKTSSSAIGTAAASFQAASGPMPKRRNERLYMAMIGPLKKIVSASCVTEVAGALVELPCPCPGSSFVNKLKHFRGIATRYEQTRQNFSPRSPVGRLSSCSTEDRPYSGGATLDPVMPHGIAASPRRSASKGQSAHPT